MNFTNPLFLIPVLTSLVFNIAGWIMQQYPPKKINSLYGYRTPASMKSQERWDFAQAFSAKEAIRSGTVLFLLSFGSLLTDFSFSQNITLGIILMILFAIWPLFKTERALKENFGHD